MKINQLSKIHKELLSENETYGVFDFSYNNVKFHIYFDIDIIPYRLGFLPIGKSEQIWLDVNKGFIINPVLQKSEYRKLTRLLNLKYDKDNPFSTFNFFKLFGEKIPNQLISLSNSERAILASKVTDIEEKEKTVYLGQKDWDKSNSGKNRSQKNLEKTRLLYPELYEQIKNKNISVIYKRPD
jgi:hypothetical protein